MRRRVQVIYRARPRIRTLVRRLKSTLTSEWPEHLKLAYGILRDDLKVKDKTAFKLIVDSLSAAQECADAINQRSDNIVERRSRAKLRVAFKRLANCSRRSSVKLQSGLNVAIRSILRQDRVDLETIEDILDAAVAEFKNFPGDKAAQTALRVAVSDGSRTLRE